MATLVSLIEEYCEGLRNRYEIMSLSDHFFNLSIEDKVPFTYDLLKSDNFLPSLVKVSTKCATKALEYRNLGNEAFRRQKDILALKYYTKSIAASPNGTQELALAFANRSAALYRLGRYTSSLLDINRALSQKYPDLLKPKLCDRKKNCIHKIKLENETKSTHLNSFSELSLNDACVQQDAENNEKNSNFNEDGTEINYDQKFCLPTINFKNEMIPNASEKISINFSTEMGRHLIANDDIKPGEILAIEKPYASILLPEYYYSHCSFCFVRSESLVPCHNCSLVMFCGEYCRENALSLFHQIECQFLPSVFSSLKLGKMELLALRILIISTKQGKELNCLLQHPLYGHPFKEKISNFKTKYISQDYFSVHNLEDNFSKRSVSDLFQRSMAAAVLLHILKQSSFFESIYKKTEQLDGLNTCESFVGTLLLKYIFAVVSNAHEISELIEKKVSPESKITTDSLEIGAALYPLLSLTNHSCDPNVVRHNHKDYVVFRSIQPIVAGEQLYDNYGYHYAIHPLEERQKLLSNQYFFECQCDPCKFDWPLHSQLPSIDPEFVSNEVDDRKIKLYSTVFKRNLQKPLNLFTDDQLNFFCEYLLLLHNSIKRPWREYNECQECVKQIMAYRGAPPLKKLHNS